MDDLRVAADRRAVTRWGVRAEPFVKVGGSRLGHLTPDRAENPKHSSEEGARLQVVGSCSDVRQVHAQSACM